MVRKKNSYFRTQNNFLANDDEHLPLDFLVHAISFWCGEKLKHALWHRASWSHWQRKSPHKKTTEWNWKHPESMIAWLLLDFIYWSYFYFWETNALSYMLLFNVIDCNLLSKHTNSVAQINHQKWTKKIMKKLESIWCQIILSIQMPLHEKLLIKKTTTQQTSDYYS